MLCQGIETGVTEYSVVIVTEYSVTPIQSPYYNLVFCLLLGISQNVNNLDQILQVDRDVPCIHGTHSNGTFCEF